MVNYSVKILHKNVSCVYETYAFKSHVVLIVSMKIFTAALVELFITKKYF